MCERLSWILGVAVFATYRMLNGTLFSAGAAISLIPLSMSLLMIIGPYLAGKEMTLLSYSSPVFVKGEDDLIRLFMFSLGVFMLIASLIM